MIRIANAQGFWGDSLEAPFEQLRGGPLDYLTLDYLAEVTMSSVRYLRNQSQAGVSVRLSQLSALVSNRNGPDAASSIFLMFRRGLWDDAVQDHHFFSGKARESFPVVA